MTRTLMCFIAAVLVGRFAMAQESRPLVEVAMSVETDAVHANFRDARVLAALEHDVAITLAERLEPLMPHIDWQAIELRKDVRDRFRSARRRRLPNECVKLTSADLRSRASGVLILRMLEGGDGAVYLRFQVVVGSTTHCLNDAPRQDLWAADFYAAPTAERRELTDELETAVVNYFAQTTKSDSFRMAVLSAIPAATGIGIEKVEGEGGARFVIPIPWEYLQPSSKTIFRVALNMRSKRRSRVVLLAHLFLAPAAPLQVDSGYIIATPIHECTNHRLRFDADPPPPSPAECDPTVPADHPEFLSYLTDETLANAIVSIATYDRDAHGAGMLAATRATR